VNALRPAPSSANFCIYFSIFSIFFYFASTLIIHRSHTHSASCPLRFAQLRDFRSEWKRSDWSFSASILARLCACGRSLSLSAAIHRARGFLQTKLSPIYHIARDVELVRHVLAMLLHASYNMISLQQISYTRSAYEIFFNFITTSLISVPIFFLNKREKSLCA